jgi:hypothetical protein
MTDEWVSREDAVWLLASERGLSAGAAEVAVLDAVDSGKVRLTARLGNLPPERVTAKMLRPLFGWLLHDVRLSLDDLQWQIEQQLGPRPGGRGPKPGTVRRYDDADCRLFCEIKRLMREEQLTITAACQRIAEAGGVAGTGTPKSRAARLAGVYRNSLNLS